MFELETRHEILIGAAEEMVGVQDGSIDLVVTSPPYPMIEMWDEGLAEQDPRIATALAEGAGEQAFELMHGLLDRVWAELARVVRPGGFVCVNVGDATRKIGDAFRLWSNHARIIQGLTARGFASLPDILWRKPTNAPNKFLGSGMLPAGAYVTYEHEYVLIFRQQGTRPFRSAAEKAQRRRSAFFWEERNLWFSDLWTDLRGTNQRLADPESRARSAAFPFELPFRLIQMYSLQGDLVLDPFVGTGTTMAAALASGRSSLGIEREPSLRPVIERSLEEGLVLGQARARQRLDDHRAFVAARLAAGRILKHENRLHGLPVVTSQEVELDLIEPRALVAGGRPGLVRAQHRSLAAIPAESDS